jgi:hypothetical protein
MTRGFKPPVRSNGLLGGCVQQVAFTPMQLGLVGFKPSQRFVGREIELCKLDIRERPDASLERALGDCPHLKRERDGVLRGTEIRRGDDSSSRKTRAF